MTVIIHRVTLKELEKLSQDNSRLKLCPKLGFKEEGEQIPFGVYQKTYWRLSEHVGKGYLV